jgi:hydroxyethylthiazole kinase-like uncharacterized protein yjeF
MLFHVVGNRSLSLLASLQVLNWDADWRKTPNWRFAMNDDHEIVLSRNEARAIDAAAISRLGLTGPLLMENAARGVADVLVQEFCEVTTRHDNALPVGRVIIICGPGNNGGDGLALVRLLAACDISADVRLLRAGRSLADDAQFNLNVLLAAGIQVMELANSSDFVQQLAGVETSDVIVDCLLGTGIRGNVRSPYLELIEAINGSPARVLAVDVPSGLDCDLGTASGVCIHADRTVTFVGRKRGFDIPESKRFTGDVSVAHIGLPQHWIRDWLSAFRAS